ncbi:cupin domain-containing protein [Streptomyces evansiae]|uniref:cupin domain-containing protein n=1 Tax=Streptomyces evansiae TaxID=3075535 RepID=UPI002884930D|nr:cupin domain-containing protein [Streptomyces sp. DSM 41859]MDT0421816.1 cupin domain-containing protein [Streptomyces sp. DSM 41859]
MCGRSACAGIDLPGHDLEAAPAALARSCVPHGFTTEPRYPASGPQAGKAALDTSRPELLRRPLPRPESVRAAELAVPDGEISVHLLFSGHEHGRTGLYRTVLPPRGRSRAGAHGAGSVEYVMVVSGHLTLVADETPYPLGPGGAARFSGAVERSFTTGTEGAVTHSVLGYPRV